jgi:hypothetical protein
MTNFIRLVEQNNYIQINKLIDKENHHTLNQALLLASQKGFEKIIKLLIKFGANINVVDNDKNSPLYYAVIYNHLYAVTTLLGLGANPIYVKDLLNERKEIISNNTICEYLNENILSYQNIDEKLIKISEQLLLPYDFFEICLNKLNNKFYEIDEHKLNEIYLETINQHLEKSYYYHLKLKKYSEKSYVLYPITKHYSDFQEKIMNQLKGLKNQKLKQGLGYIFPLYKLIDLQSFLLNMKKENIQIILNLCDQMSHNKFQYKFSEFLLQLVPYFNKNISNKEIKRLLDKTIPDYYNKKKLYEIIHISSSVNEFLILLSDKYLIKDDDGCVNLDIAHQKYWSRSFLISKNNVKDSKIYKEAQNYSPYYNPYYINISKDNHIALLEHSSYTGD